MNKIFALFIIFFNLCFANISEHFPPLTGRVVDGAKILNESTKQKLENILAKEENSSTTQIVIVTLDSLHGYSIEEFGYKLARHWDIGQKDKNNGVLLIVAPHERKVRIEVGYGLEGILTDKASHEIIEYLILPEFKNANLNAGILKGTQEIINVLSGQKNREKDDNNVIFNLFGFGFIIANIVIFLGFIFGSSFLKKIGASFYLAGSLLLLISKYLTISALFGQVLFVVILFFIYLLFKDVDLEKNEDNTTLIGNSGFGLGSSLTDSIFSGGGGSFGGGGASGSW